MSKTATTSSDLIDQNGPSSRACRSGIATRLGQTCSTP